MFVWCMDIWDAGLGHKGYVIFKSIAGLFVLSIHTWLQDK